MTATGALANSPCADPIHNMMANAIRALSMDAVQKANSGHPGMPMGMADVATVLFSRFLKFDASKPDWADRDRFILSGGHGSMLLYSLLYLTGYEKMTLEQIKNFRQMGSLTAGHPERDIPVGIEMTTGPLGQGISSAVGFALAERILNARFGDDLVDHNTFVMCGDGDLMEGISHEACSLAGTMRLSNLTVLYDDNDICIDGSTDMTFTDDTMERFRAYGWHVQRVDGHDPEAIASAIENAIKSPVPSMISCKTTIGYGAPTKAGTSGCHGAPLGEEEIAGAREALEWPHAPFDIPENILNEWRTAGSMGAQMRREWEERLASVSESTAAAFKTAMNEDISERIAPVIQELKANFAADKPKHATRKTSGTVLESLLPAIPEMVGGSADLTGSNLTIGKDTPIVSADTNYDGQYIYYGVREHGMAAAMNGMALHGGVVPYGGTFMSFADYCRPSIRLAALMKTRAIYVMTHDSIGLGEDGPTHQPVEHVASLRAMPNTLVFRPCDGVETAESWELALNKQDGPSLLSLTRQGLPTLRDDSDLETNKCARGAYVLSEASSDAKVVIMATGSEVEIAMKAQEMLEADGIPTRLVSAPCLDLFAEQDESYQNEILGGDTTIKAAIEAASRFGWDRWIGPKGVFVGMDGFGASAPADELYKHFGITAENLSAQVKAKL